MRGRRYRRSAHGSNPFVVLSDVTISLSIVFLVFGIGAAIANNQFLLDFNRNERQNRIEAEFVQALKSAFPGAAESKIVASGDSRTHVRLVQDGSVIAEVWTNSSFQRVRVLAPTFDRRSARLTDSGAKVARQLGNVIQRQANQLSYLFLHGVTEKAEAAGQSRATIVELSLERARAVRALLTEQGVIGSAGVLPRNAIPFGMGEDLYATGAVEVGRVEFVLFFNDLSRAEKG